MFLGKTLTKYGIGESSYFPRQLFRKGCNPLVQVWENSPLQLLSWKLSNWCHTHPWNKQELLCIHTVNLINVPLIVLNYKQQPWSPCNLVKMLIGSRLQTNVWKGDKCPVGMQCQIWFCYSLKKYGHVYKWSVCLMFTCSYQHPSVELNLASPS